jgi:DNA-binding MarR family transcriptional regulator
MKHTRQGDALTQLILAIFKTNGRLLAAGDRLVQPAGLTSARWQALGAMALSATPQPVANLARAMGLTRQAVQRTVNELAAEGLVTFDANPHHQRAKLVLLTKKGQDAYDAASRLQTPWANAVANGLSAKDLALATRILDDLTRRLETS